MLSVKLLYKIHTARAAFVFSAFIPLYLSTAFDTVNQQIVLSTSQRTSEGESSTVPAPATQNKLEHNIRTIAHLFRLNLHYSVCINCVCWHDENKEAKTPQKKGGKLCR